MGFMASRNNAGYRIPIGNPQALADELRSVVSVRFNGNQSAAARAARLKQPHFAKLCSASLASVTRRTALALRQLVPAERRAAFDTLFLNDKARHLILNVYRPWVDEASHGVPHDARWDWDVVDRRIKEFGGEDETTYFDYQTKVNQILTEWQNDFPSYLARLDRAIERGGHSFARRQISLLRMCEPLLDHHASGLIERGWHELDRTEKGRFLSASVGRETILLKRDRDAL
jgi:hypothetical protein